MAKSYCGKYTVDYLTELMGLSGENADISEILENVKNTGNYYTDPDRHSNPPKWSDYYERIEDYLNNQEECFYKRELIEEKWKYKFIGNETPSGIRVTTGNDKLIYSLVLRSDQFGFSAPRINGKTITACSDKYPYWCYLEKSNNNKANDVVNWITNTRTIGGSFIWPVWKKDGVKNLYSYYNVGDKKNKLKGRGVGSYIEDSVDLTLYEVKHYYDWINSEENKDKDITKDYTYTDDVLYKTELESEKSPMVTWLNHFGTFETYVKFFMFDDDFVKSEFKMSEELMKLIKDCFVENEIQEELDYYSFCKNNVPKNLLDGSDLNDDLVEGYKNDFKDKKRRIANNEREPEELEKILNRLSDMTLMRTARMLEVINNSESSKS